MLNWYKLQSSSAAALVLGAPSSLHLIELLLDFNGAAQYGGHRLILPEGDSLGKAQSWDRGPCFHKHWASWAGIPGKLVLDLDACFRDSFWDLTYKDGIAMRCAASQAHWRNCREIWRGLEVDLGQAKWGAPDHRCRGLRSSMCCKWSPELLDESVWIFTAPVGFWHSRTFRLELGWRRAGPRGDVWHHLWWEGGA